MARDSTGRLTGPCGGTTLPGARRHAGRPASATAAWRSLSSVLRGGGGAGGDGVAAGESTVTRWLARGRGDAVTRVVGGGVHTFSLDQLIYHLAKRAAPRPRQVRAGWCRASQGVRRRRRRQRQEPRSASEAAAGLNGAGWEAARGRHGNLPRASLQPYDT